jgi:hypothetical protein
LLVRISLDSSSSSFASSSSSSSSLSSKNKYREYLDSGKLLWKIRGDATKPQLEPAIYITGAITKRRQTFWLYTNHFLLFEMRRNREPYQVPEARSCKYSKGCIRRNTSTSAAKHQPGAERRSSRWLRDDKHRQRRHRSDGAGESGTECRKLRGWWLCSSEPPLCYYGADTEQYQWWSWRWRS